MGPGSNLFWTSKFDKSQLYSPLTYYEIPKSYLFALTLKNSIVALVRYLIIAQTYPIFM